MRLLARRAVVLGFRGPPARATAALLETIAGSPRGSFAVLTYHRVDERYAKPWLYPYLLSATPDGFEAQMAWLQRHHRVIGLPDLLEAMRRGRTLPPRAVLITVDDAYTDFRDNAWPILRKFGLPATLFVPTAYPDVRDRSFWWDRVWQAVTGTRSRRAIDTPFGPLPIRNDRERQITARALVEHFKTLPHEVAMRNVDALCDRLDAKPPSSDVLTWRDLRLLNAEGVHIAVHSRTHPLLTRVSADAVREEIDGSRNDLKRQLGDGVYPTVFAYPAGAHNAQTKRVLADLGIELAFTTQRGANHVGRSDPLELRRFNVGSQSGTELVRMQVALGTLRDRIGRG